MQRLHFKSKNESNWRQIDNDEIEFIRTDIQRKRKDIIAAAQAESDQEDIEDFIEEANAANQQA